jgi:hypothetical protein
MSRRLRVASLLVALLALTGGPGTASRYHDTRAHAASLSQFFSRQAHPDRQRRAPARPPALQPLRVAANRSSSPFFLDRTLPIALYRRPPPAFAR